MIAKAGW